MGSFNLLDEPWISVISMDGQQLDVSLKDVFSHAQEYQCLAGEMEAQNFAVLRFLLAVVQTVFSRFDSDGKPYEGIELDQRMRQLNTLDSEDYEDDRDACWDALWKKGAFPEIVNQYLETWRDHFFLYDDRFPFYQVTQKEMSALLPAGKNPTEMKGRNFNRLISESGHKIAMFSPVRDYKEKDFCKRDAMTSAQLARWLIMLQGYFGVSDKASAVKDGRKSAIGWLYGLGGTYIKGSNLFETMMLNFIPVHSDDGFKFSPQSPCWEHSGYENAEKLIRGDAVDNFAELYTNWSRAIVIDPKVQNQAEKVVYTAKLPVISNNENLFLEPMTIWQEGKKPKGDKKLKGDEKSKGDEKTYLPMKYKPEQALWRNFGMIVPTSSAANGMKTPLVIKCLNSHRRLIGDKVITICAVSMKDNGNATSLVITDELADELSVNDMAITDETDRGWIVRISEAVDTTKNVVAMYRRFLAKVAEIRGISEKSRKPFVAAGEEDFYQSLNYPFREWLISIKPENSKDQKISEWHEELKSIANAEAREIVDQATVRDYMGSNKNGGDNIVTAYQKFIGGISKILK